MANKIFQSTQLSIEVESDIDKDGNPTYKKKNIGNLKETADVDVVAALVGKISNVLNSNTRYFYLTDLSLVQ